MSEDELTSKAGSFIYGLAKFCAFIVVAVFTVIAFNGVFHFIPTDQPIYQQVLDAVYKYGAMVVVSLLMVGFAIKRSFFLQLIIYALIAVAFLFSFFPDVLSGLFGTLGLPGSA